MDVYLTALGCRLNEAEVASWGRSFHQSGHRVVSAPEHADLIVLNSCAVTGEAARKSRKLTRRLHRRNPTARLVLTGCFADLAPEQAAELAGVDLVVSNLDKPRLPQLVGQQLVLSAMPRRAQEPDATPLREIGKTRAFVKVQDGCRNRCTFCIVTIARGEERSRPIDEIVTEIDRLAAAGYQEVVLTGVHLGGYGAEMGVSLSQLVIAVLARSRIPRLRLSSLEPWDLPPRFFALWRDPRLCPHLHLPLQSGSDRILRLMGRRCSRQRYRELVAAARDQVPDLCVSSDIIVGFPQESAADWQATLEFVEEIGFSQLHIFGYSPRDGTAAARMPGQVTDRVKQARSAELHQMAAQMRSAQMQRSIGQTRAVLWETKAEPPADTHTPAVRFSGLTDNYLRVTTTVPAGVALENIITQTTLTGVDGAGLIGRIRSGTARSTPHGAPGFYRARATRR